MHWEHTIVRPFKNIHERTATLIVKISLLKCVMTLHMWRTLDDTYLTHTHTHVAGYSYIIFHPFCPDFIPRISFSVPAVTSLSLLFSLGVRWVYCSDAFPSDVIDHPRVIEHRRLWHCMYEYRWWKNVYLLNKKKIKDIIVSQIIRNESFRATCQRINWYQRESSTLTLRCLIDDSK